ncbi:MAG TPA: hypothetical protein VI758_07265 [Bacteroidota bacterium]
MVPADTVAMGFERVLNTFIWKGMVGFAVVDSNTSLKVHQGLSSKLIRTNPVATQGQYDGFIGLQSTIANDWKFRARTSSLVVSDNQSIDLGKLAQHQGFMGVGYASAPWDIGILGGYEIDAQESVQDRGPAFDLSLASSGLHFQEIQARLQSEWTKSFLGRRTPEQQSVGFGMARDFGAGSTDSLVFNYSKLRREFYTSADSGTRQLYAVDHNIFRRDAVGYDISNELTYAVLRNTSIIVRTGLSNRTIDRGFVYKNFLNPSSITLDSQIQELVLNGSVSLSSGFFDWLLADVGMAFEERDERFTVFALEGIPVSVIQQQVRSAKQLEYTSQRTSVWTRILSAFSERDRLQLNGSASILRYDTPDSLNTDDRDELLLAVSLDETHTLNRFVTVGLEFSATLSHLVYLDRSKSANNNWNRVLSLSPRVSLHPVSWLTSENTGEVVANYTVYDFEEQVASVKSFSFRQASWSDSTVIDLTRRIEFLFAGGLRVYERGLLKWSDFKEKPLDYFVEKSLWPQLKYRTLDDLSLCIGYRLFSRYQYAYNGAARNLSHWLSTTGPTVAVEWNGVNGTKVVLDGWREMASNDSGTTTAISNVSIRVNLLF